MAAPEESRTAPSSLAASGGRSSHLTAGLRATSASTSREAAEGGSLLDMATPP